MALLDTVALDELKREVERRERANCKHEWHIEKFGGESYSNRGWQAYLRCPLCNDRAEFRSYDSQFWMLTKAAMEPSNDN